MTHSPTQKPKTTQNWPKPLPQARHWLGWTDLWQIPRRQGPRPGLCLRTSRDDTGHFHQLQLQPRSHPELEGGPQLKGKKSIETSRQFGNQIFSGVPFFANFAQTEKCQQTQACFGRCWGSKIFSGPLRWPLKKKIPSRPGAAVGPSPRGGPLEIPLQPPSPRGHCKS